MGGVGLNRPDGEAALGCASRGMVKLCGVRKSPITGTTNPRRACVLAGVVVIESLRV